MENKEFLIETLKDLIGVWPEAKELIIEIEKGIYDEDSIVFMADKLRESISEVNDSDTKAKMEEGLDAIMKISRLEHADKEKDDKKLLEMEDMLDEL